MQGNVVSVLYKIFPFYVAKKIKKSYQATVSQLEAILSYYCIMNNNFKHNLTEQQ